MEKLTLEQIAPCLPYGLKGHFTNLPKGNLFTVSGYEIEDNEGVEDVFIIGSCGPYGGQRGLIETFVPYFLPLSSLTKPMEDGSVPLMVLKTGGTNANVCTAFFDSSYGEMKYSCCDNEGHELIYTQNYGFQRFYKGELRALNQLALFQYLAKEKIDFMGLIDAGLAIDVTTLPENPYK